MNSFNIQYKDILKQAFLSPSIRFSTGARAGWTSTSRIAPGKIGEHFQVQFNDVESFRPSENQHSINNLLFTEIYCFCFNETEDLEHHSFAIMSVTRRRKKRKQSDSHIDGQNMTNNLITKPMACLLYGASRSITSQTTRLGTLSSQSFPRSPISSAYDDFKPLLNQFLVLVYLNVPATLLILPVI